MKKSARNLVLVLMAALCPLIAFGRGSDVTFRGTVTRIEQISSGRLTVTVRLERSELPVQLTIDTDIEANGDIVSMSSLSSNDYVEISGYFSSAGIVAKGVHIFDDHGIDFRVHGSISSVTPSSGGCLIAVNGISVLVDSDTLISKRGADDRLASSSLAAGMEIDARGSLQDGRLHSRSVKLGSRADDGVRIRFEGQIVKIEDGRLFVDTQGGGTAVVLLNSGTVMGNFSVGQRVDVKGGLNERLEVEAERIQVEGAETNDDHGGHGNDDTQADDHAGNGNDDPPGDDHGNDGSGHH